MGTQTGITWADATWNPWIGCTPVSEGCQHCYARRDMARWGKDFSTVKRSAAKTFNLPLAKKRDGSWKIPDGSFVFVCSWSDFFHEAAEEWWDDAWNIMRQRSGLTFLLLTKRIERLRRYADDVCVPPDRGLSHICLGVTAENQARADERIPQLLSIDWPGKKFVSVEPMLGPIDLNAVPRTDNAYLRQCGGTGVLPDKHEPDDYVWSLKESEWGGISWIICGGESGPGARELTPAWARTLRDQCRRAGVPFWMKQMGGWPDRREGLEELPEDLRIRERP